MQRVLLTGMSGTGKSSVVRRLAEQVYKAVDLDDAWCEAQPDGRRLWREDAVRELLDTEDADVLFVAGCEENQARFDHVVLLSAPVGTLLTHRRQTRQPVRQSRGGAGQDPGRPRDRRAAAARGRRPRDRDHRAARRGRGVGPVRRRTGGVP